LQRKAFWEENLFFLGLAERPWELLPDLRKKGFLAKACSEKRE